MMIRLKTLIGACVVCALVLSAVVAQGASAVGTTGFTCKEKKEPGGAGFSDAHCTTAVSTGAKFEHVAIPEGTKTEGRVTNEKTASETTASTVAKLKGSLSGVEVELQATSTLGEATGTNSTSAGEMFIEGTGHTTYSGVTVTKPAGKGCKVKEGKLVTNELRGTSLGQGMEGKLEPASGETFLSITIEGCTVAALNNTFPITGSIKCPNVGATITCTHASTTAQGTLKFGGTKAGIEVATTATARAKSTESFTPVAATTIP